MSTGVKAGWYDDPAGAVMMLRYWNGEAWTEHVKPKSQTLQAPPGSSYQAGGFTPAYAPQYSVVASGEHPNDVMHWLVPNGRSWQTITSGYLGLLSLGIFILGPFAILTGILGMRAAKRQGSHGRGRAIFGIVTGCIGTLFLVLTVGSFVLG